MSPVSAPRILVELTFAEDLPLLAEESPVAELQKVLAGSLRELLASLGMDGVPEVAVHRRGRGNRVMQVCVGGTRVLFSPRIMGQVWQSLAPPQLSDLPVRGTPGPGFPDQWLRQYLNQLNSSRKDEVDFALTYLSALALASIQERPSCLIRSGQVLAYLQKVGGASPVDPERAAFALKFLLDHGVSAAEGPLILRTLRQGEELGRPVEDAAEVLFARLRSPAIEILVSPKDFQQLTGADPIERKEGIPAYGGFPRGEVHELLSRMEEGLFWDVGIYVPDLRWKTRTDMPEGRVAFQVNDRITIQQRLLGPGQILVNETPERLLRLGIAGTPSVHPAKGNRCTMVSEVHKKKMEEMGFPVWTPFAFLTLLLAAEIKRRSAELFTVADAEHHLAKVGEAFPALVEQITRRFGMEDLARTLRGLLAEGISIHNLPFLLERLRQYDRIEVDAGQFIVFDERLPVSPGSLVLPGDSWQSYREFVRSGMKRTITYSLLGGQSTLAVYLVDPALERWLVTENFSKKEEDLDSERQAVREGIWNEIGKHPEVAPVVLTSTEPRVALQEILRAEMPDVRVVSYSELTPDTNIQPIARVPVPPVLEKVKESLPREEFLVSR